MSLLLWYPFTQDGYNRGMIEGNHLSPTMNNTGVLGKCGLANNVTLSTNVDIGGIYSPLNSSLTMTCWVKFNFDECAAVIDNMAWSNFASNKTTPTGGIAGSMSYNTVGIIWTANNIYNGGTRAAFSKINVFGYTRGNAQITTSAASITLGKWTHLALTLNKDTKLMKFYVNGVLVGTEKSYASNTTYTANRTFGLNQLQVYGGNGPGARLPIYYNDVRLYDEELSAMEVKELAKGLMVRYTFDNPYAEPTTNLIHGKYQGFQSSLTKLTETYNGMEIYKNVVTKPYTGTAADNAGFCHKAAIPHTQEQAKQPYFQLSFWKRLNQSYGVNIGGYIYVTYTDETTGKLYWSFNKSNWGTDANSIGKWEYITARATIASGKTVKEITRFYVYGRSATGGDCDFAGIQLEAKDHPTPFTESSREFNLENETDRNLVAKAKGDNVYFVSDSGMGTRALRTQGTVSKVSFAASSYLLIDMGESITPTQFSLITYAKVNAIGHQTSGFISMATTETDPTNYQNYTLAQYDSKFQLNAAGSTTGTSLSSNVIKTGEWHLYSFVWDGATWSSYRDGVLNESKAAAFTADPFRYIYLGYNGAGGAPRNADITWGDFRLYGKALTADEILEIAETKAAIDKNHNVYSNEFVEQHVSGNMVNEGSWEQGGIQDTNGADSNNMPNRIRSKYIPVLPGATYNFSVGSGMSVRGVHYYDQNNVWISYVTGAGNRTTPDNCAYLRWVIQGTNSSTEVPVSNIVTYKPMMVYSGHPTNYNVAAKMDVQVNKEYTIETKDICENHKTGFFKDGTLSANKIYEI